AQKAKSGLAQKASQRVKTIVIAAAQLISCFAECSENQIVHNIYKLEEKIKN
ncbi:MAG: hypothetical protein ACJAZH_001635, partial [Roseivirga sp.]